MYLRKTEDFHLRKTKKKIVTYFKSSNSWLALKRSFASGTC